MIESEIKKEIGSDIFDRCYAYDRADKVKEKGLYPYFHAIEENEGPEVMVEGKKMVMAGSNNYLGLTADPRVKAAAAEALNRFGTGCSGSRYLTGTLRMHNELEEKLADFLGFESVLLFSTGYQTALGTVSTLVQKGDYVVSDKDNHACIVNGAMMAKGAFANFVRYKHNDMDSLEKTLQSIPENTGKLIVSDGVFSVTGSIMNLPEVVKLAKKYGARVLADDAHALGVIGKGGRGTPSHFGLEAETDMVMGTFSKSLASLGGYVAGPERVINFLKHNSPALIFSASPTPSSVAAALKSLEIIEEEPWRVDRLTENARYMKKGFREIGYDVIANETAIVPVLVGDDEKAIFVWKKLFDRGVFVNAFIPPGVPEGMSMMRTSYMATHEKQHLDYILNAFQEVGKELELI
ncbi:MAG: aminotransferase class I/II-fold pyridoxal phosphate-dependent enzyme [Candidatus Kapaibacteriales bacterium]